MIFSLFRSVASSLTSGVTMPLQSPRGQGWGMQVDRRLRGDVYAIAERIGSWLKDYFCCSFDVEEDCPPLNPCHHPVQARHGLMPLFQSALGVMQSAVAAIRYNIALKRKEEKVRFYWKQGDIVIFLCNIQIDQQITLNGTFFDEKTVRAMSFEEAKKAIVDGCNSGWVKKETIPFLLFPIVVDHHIRLLLIDYQQGTIEHFDPQGRTAEDSLLPLGDRQSTIGQLMEATAAELRQANPPDGSPSPKWKLLTNDRQQQFDCHRCGRYLCLFLVRRIVEKKLFAEACGQEMSEKEIQEVEALRWQAGSLDVDSSGEGLYTFD